MGRGSRGSDSQRKSGRPGASGWGGALKLPCAGFSIQRKDDADDDVGDRPRDERDQPERRLAGQGLVERERQAQTEDEMPGQAPGDEGEGVAEGLGGDGVDQGPGGGEQGGGRAG